MGDLSDLVLRLAETPGIRVDLAFENAGTALLSHSRSIRDGFQFDAFDIDRYVSIAQEGYRQLLTETMRYSFPDDFLQFQRKYGGIWSEHPAKCRLDIYGLGLLVNEMHTDLIGERGGIPPLDDVPILEIGSIYASESTKGLLLMPLIGSPHGGAIYLYSTGGQTQLYADLRANSGLPSSAVLLAPTFSEFLSWLTTVCQNAGETP